MRRRPLLTALPLAALGATTTTIAACSSPSPVKKTTTGADKIAVGVIAIVDVAPIYLGKAKGFFSQRNIDMALTAGSGGTASITGVVSGQLAYGFANITSLLIAQDKGIALKVLASGNASTGVSGKDFGAVVVRPDSPLRTPKDLSGHTVSVNNLNNIGDTTIRASVRKAGGDPKKVRFVELAFPDAPAAVLSGKVDAAWVVEPFLTMALSQGARVVSWNMVDTAPKMTVACYFASQRQTRDNPDLTQRFTAAINQSLAYAQSHPDEARAILKTYTKISADLLPKITLPDWPTDLNRDSIATIAQLAQQDGLLTKSAGDIGALLP